MQIYLPIAELSVDIFMILAIGAAVGFLSGMLGVGGGFLMTPLLIFTGIPPAVAVATGANQIVATSASGALAHWRRGGVDVKLGLVLLAGGIVGGILGVWIFRLLRQVGQIDLIITLSYVTFLGVIGAMMVWESARAIIRTWRGYTPTVRRPGQHTWIHGLPLKMRFTRSRLYVSAIPVAAVGFLVGIMVSIMGIGGGFIMVPAMIYLLRVPTGVVIGTSLFQILFVTALVTVLHAAANYTLDVVLALLLMTGGVVGAQLGAQASQKLRGEQLRALLGLLVLAVCVRMGATLVLRPDDLFSLSLMEDLL